jgi:hypothetical protein
MRLYANNFSGFCAVVATLLLLLVGSVVLGHSDCDESDVACECACHDAAAVHSRPDLFIPHASVEIVRGEVGVLDLLIPRDIFRPPAV